MKDDVKYDMAEEIYKENCSNGDEKSSKLTMRTMYLLYFLRRTFNVAYKMSQVSHQAGYFWTANRHYNILKGAILYQTLTSQDMTFLWVEDLIGLHLGFWIN